MGLGISNQSAEFLVEQRARSVVSERYLLVRALQRTLRGFLQDVLPTTHRQMLFSATAQAVRGVLGDGTISLTTVTI